MDVFLTTLKALIDGLGATIALPIIIFIVALVLGAKPGKAFRAGVVIGIAFIGINLVIGLMWGALSDVGQALVKNLGITRDVVDVAGPLRRQLPLAPKLACGLSRSRSWSMWSSCSCAGPKPSTSISGTSGTSRSWVRWSQPSAAIWLTD
jgi:hypothetical protein